MSPQNLPEAAHADLDSMLSRKFGKEVANYFSGNRLVSDPCVCRFMVVVDDY